MKTHDTYKGEDHVFGYASLVLVLSTVLAKIFRSLNSFKKKLAALPAFSICEWNFMKLF